MTRFYLIGFLCLMAADTLAQICFKLAGTSAAPLELKMDWALRILASPWSYGALIGYVCSFVTWMALLRHAPIGPAFAASHMELISVTLLSAWLFHEPITFSKAAGGLLILLGVYCLARGESESAGVAGKRQACAVENGHEAGL